MRLLSRLAVPLVLVLCQAALGQTVTGSIVGSVVDSSGASITGAAVRLISESTGASREAVTGQSGNFAFHAVLPGAYTLQVEQPSFKKYERKKITLEPNETLAAGAIALEVGAVAESVTVTAQGATVQTAGSERSGVLTSSQIENLTIINRDFSTLVSLMPGVYTDVAGEAQGFSQNPHFYVQGGRAASNNIMIDGLATDSSNAAALNTYVSMDSVDTVRIQVSNFAAEFGRKPGAAIQAVTKSGTQRFHGALYWYQRNEDLNATDFFNNRNGIKQPPYRYITGGFNIGGPVSFREFNHNRQKLFFFASSEQLREQRPQAIRQITMPTAAERLGDFSNSRNTNGALIVVKDPTTKAAYPGNIVPKTSLNPNGQALLNLWPTPNLAPGGVLNGYRYNYQVQESVRVPKTSETGRMDYVITPKTTVYGRFNYWWEQQSGWSVTAGNGNWGWLPSAYRDKSYSTVLSGAHIFSPTLVGEASMGYTRWLENDHALTQADLDHLNKTKQGINIPQFHPELNPDNLAENVSSWGGVNAAPTVKIEGRFPLRGAENTFVWNGNLTKVMRGHNFKVGAYVERWRELKGETGTFNGSFDFGTSGNNPNDSGYAFANAVLGNFYSYSESNTRVPLRGRTTTVEWFAQDTWRVTSRLTLDLGVRWGWAQPFHSNLNDEAGFLPQLWDPSKRVLLIRPTTVNGTRMGINPLNGQLYNQVAVGAIVPGSGDPYNGTINREVDPSYPQGLRSNSGVKTGPRIGFSWDPFGKGKTAIRGGFGAFYDLHERDNFINGIFYNPPLQLNPIIYFGNLATFTSQPSLQFPSNTTGFDGPWKVDRTMNSHFGIQQNIGWGTVVDVAYAGSLARHLQEQHNLNSTPFGANFQARNIDPTNGKPYASTFLSPYTGYGNIIMHSYDANSSYHSLQVSANRRFAHGVQFGAAWTWSKAMDYVDDDQTSISYNMPPAWNYGRASFDRTHIVKINWIWELPNASHLSQRALVRFLGDGWQLSSIETFQSGAPTGVSLGYASGFSPDITGSTDSARVNVIADPLLPKDQRTFSQFFNTAAFALPAVGTYGDATKDVFRGPGLNNWDLSAFKNFKFRERLRVQARGEFYNAWNHTQFTSVDNATRFDAKGNQTNPTFGQFTASRPGRRVQVALRVTF